MPDSANTAAKLTNPVTPDKKKTSSVKRYLREFFSDTRVVEGKGDHRLSWLILLNLVILNFHLPIVAKPYQADEESNAA